ncbi:Ig-like domain-containing protein [Bradyrhizobium retamae]|uniref:Ig-like domain-containing protein n=1 Tax=Bradyrhizobium retamae TaxID=1300035 RepID=UPI000B2DDE6A|nr:Ig-like domain-containing protein [Bradyrhizobium retamae]
MTGTIDPARFGMPDATTTGVPAGTTLTAYTGPMNITQDGTVIEGKIIDGQLAVKAANVTIRNCIIKSDGWWGIEGENSPNLRVENCDIIGGNLTNSGILGSGTFVGNDISHVSIGIQLTDGASTVSGNYIHDLFYGSADPHYDGVTALGGQNHVVIEHNTIIAPNNNGTAAVFIDNDFGSVNDVTVRDNLMFGDPAYTVHVAQKAGLSGIISNVVIENNYLDRGHYGYIAVQNTTATIRNNVQWDNSTDPTPYPTSSPTPPSTPTPPSAPTIASFSNDTGAAGDGITSDNTLQLQGTAAANSTVKVLDGTTQIGATTANSSGAWTYTTAALSDGNHSLKATATTTSGTSSTSSVLALKIDTAAPTAPTMATPTNNANGGLNLAGTAEANSVVKVFDGTTQIGTATANSGGAWGYTTGALAAGSHSLTAKATDAAGNTGAASAVVTASIGTSAPPVPPTSPTPTPSEQVESAGATSLVESGGKYHLYSSSGSGPTLKYGGADFVDGQDGTWTPIGAEKTATGYQVAWKEASTGQYTAWNTDNNGNYVSHVSALTGSVSGGQVSGTNNGLKTLETSFHQDLNSDGQIGASSATAPISSVDLTTMYKNWSDIVTIKGVADANSQIKLYDGNASLGTVNTAADGSWSFKTSSAVSDTVHTYTAKQIDSTGQVVGTSGNAILGSTGSNTLKGTSGDDLFAGNGGADTFVFAPNFGNDVVKDFGTYGRSHDVVQFSKSVFDSFASVLAHATQVGENVVISADADNSVTLKNTKLSAIDKYDFQFS